MKRIALPIIIGLSSLMSAQVGINTLTPKATLELAKSETVNSAEGFLTVRISGTDLVAKDAQYGADQNSTVVYVTSVPITVTPKTSNITTPDFYYYKNSISKWVALAMPKFFYMPSVLFDTTTMGAASKDLYQLYYNQFTNPAKASVGSAGKIPVVGREDLEYYITSYDTNVFTNVTVSEGGLMNYTVSSDATEASFINIIFVLK